jgi:chitinase
VKPPSINGLDGRPFLLRLLLTVAIAAALGGGAVLGYQWRASSTAEPSPTAKGPAAAPWFAGYVDVTTEPAFDPESPQAAAGRDVVLFAIAGPADGACTPLWGAALTLDQASKSLDLDRKIARLRQRGGEVAVSFGGQRNAELAKTCPDVGRLTAAYASVLERYDVSTVDLDVEGASLDDRGAARRRAGAMKRLQQDRKALGKPLTIWLTLPVSPNGLTEPGRTAVGEMLRAGVDLAGVNALTMDYSASRVAGQSMLGATTDALTAMQRQLKALYLRSGIDMSDKKAWSKVGATPMIGQNDVPNEVFGLDAAKSLNTFVLSRGIGRVSMWSLNRDVVCEPGYDVTRASTRCSGVNQRDGHFASRQQDGR